MSWMISAGKDRGLGFNDLWSHFFADSEPTECLQTQQNTRRTSIRGINPFSLAVAENEEGKTNIRHRPQSPKAGKKLGGSPIALILRHLREVSELNDTLLRVILGSGSSPLQLGANRSANLFTAYNQLCAPASVILAELMAAGILFDRKSGEACLADLRRALVPLEKHACLLAGWKVSLTKPHDVAKVLWEEMNLKKQVGGSAPITKRHFTTSQRVLVQLADTNEFARVVLEHRRLSKILNTYVEPFLNSSSQGRVYPR